MAEAPPTVMAPARLCGRCGAPCGVTDRYCHACGTEFRFCPHCGAQAAPTDRFCHACGAPVAAPTAVVPPPPPPPPPRREPQRGLVLAVWADSAKTYGRHLHHLLPSALAAEAIAVAFQIGWYAIIGRSWWSLVFLGPGAFYLVYFVLAGIHVREIEETREGHHDWNVWHTIREARPQLPTLFAVGIVAWIVIDLVYVADLLLAFGSDKWWIGLPIVAAFLAGMYWFITRTACFAQALVLENLRPWPALRRSLQLTKGRFWRLLLIVVVTATVTAILGLVLEDVVFPYAYGSSPDAQSFTELGPHSAGGYFAAVVAEALTIPFGLLVGVYLYLHLRDRFDAAPAQA